MFLGPQACGRVGRVHRVPTPCRVRYSTPPPACLCLVAFSCLLYLFQKECPLLVLWQVLVTHQLQFLTSVDEIVVLSKGAILAKGTFEVGRSAHTRLRVETNASEHSALGLGSTRCASQSFSVRMPFTAHEVTLLFSLAGASCAWWATAQRGVHYRGRRH